MHTESALIVALNTCQTPCVPCCDRPRPGSRLRALHPQDGFQPIATLDEVFPRLPKPIEGQRQAHRPLGIVSSDQPIESRSQIVMLGIAQLQPARPFWRRER